MAARVIHSGDEIPTYPIPKDPDSVVDYGFDWKTKWLDPDELIVSSTWIVPDDLVIESGSHNGRVTAVYLSGGRRKQTYLIRNRIITNKQRTEDRSFYLLVDNK